MNTSTTNVAALHAEGRYYQVGDRRLWVEQEGAGEPVLLLSGLGPAGSHLIFHPQFSALAKDHRVIYVDLFGRGRSDAPADLREISFQSDVSDVVGLITELNVGPVHIYGFSYGGLLGQAVALEHPELVRTLTLANSLHSPEMWQANHANINRELANQCPDTWAEIQRLRSLGVVSTDPRMQKEFGVAAKLVRFYNPDHAERLLSEPGSRNHALYPLFCGADIDFIVGGRVAEIPDFRLRLRELSVPLLVLSGRYDRALYPALQRQFVEFAPKGRFHVLERSGSFGHIEEPEEVFRVLRDFWESAPRQDR